MRILIAEDERDLNHILTERLRKEHYSVDACFDGQEALDYLEGTEYDALILDIMMPVMDGLTVLKKAPQQRKLCPCAPAYSQGQHRRPGEWTGRRSQ